MLRLLIDQDLDQVILRGLLLRVPNLDVITAHQVGLSDASDPDLLAWAAEQTRIVVTMIGALCPITQQTGSSEAKALPV
jgi:predicted nuclease of predicted toxin-antitoxin system